MQRGRWPLLVKDSRRTLIHSCTSSIRATNNTPFILKRDSWTVKWIMAHSYYPQSRLPKIGLTHQPPSFPAKIHVTGVEAWGSTLSWLCSLEKKLRKRTPTLKCIHEVGSLEKWAHINTCILFSNFLETPWLKINFLNCIVNCWSLISAKCDWNLGEKWTWAAPAGAATINLPATHIVATFLQILHQVARLWNRINDLSEVKMLDDYPQAF